MRKNGKYYRRRRSVINRQAFTILALVVLVTGIAVGGTLAYLSTETEQVQNTFTPAQVTVNVTEVFTNNVKSNVNAVNNSNIPVFIRIKLVTYRLNDAGQKIGGAAEVPSFELGQGWFEKDGFYYYSSAVDPGESPANPLIGTDGITLQSYSDADGGKQVIEVIAEAIQADGLDANGNHPVTLAWGVTVNADGTLSDQ